MRFWTSFAWLVATLLGAAAAAGGAPPRGASRFAFVGPAGTFVYRPYNSQGDTVPDFSSCGYGGGGVPLPRVAAAITLRPLDGTGDDTERIQQAIDEISRRPVANDGFRGAVVLARGLYRLAGSLSIRASGVVLRGEGSDERGTVLEANAARDEPLIRVGGDSGPDDVRDSRQKITSHYVPVGAKKLAVADASRFQPGDTVFVRRMGNAAWIHEIGMDRIKPRPDDPSSTRQWAPFELDFDRVVTAVEGHFIIVDAPITCAIDARWGGGQIELYSDEGRIEHVGIENLRAVSRYDRQVVESDDGQEYFADEDHGTFLVDFDRVKNAWARELTAVHFIHGVSSIGRDAKWITVVDCQSLAPVSKITGGRRYPFSVEGQLCLVRGCYSEHARHAFAVGSRVPGPNVFLECMSRHDHGTSEPHHRWSTGGLYDNVEAQIAIQDRQYMGSGHGWAGANYVVWNCRGSLVCQEPPTAMNLAIGFCGEKEEGAFPRPDGIWESFGRPVEPRSLYLKQLEDRLHSPNGSPSAVSPAVGGR